MPLQRYRPRNVVLLSTTATPSQLATPTALATPSALDGAVVRVTGSTNASPQLARDEALAKLARRFSVQLAAQAIPNVVDWLHANYYIPETSAPVVLQPNQRTILNMAMHGQQNFVTVLYSTIKKSGKTAVAGGIGRYTAEFSGAKSEVYFVANDKEQAKDRAYESAKTSIELDPRYDKHKRVLAGGWKIIERQALHEATGSIMRAIASDYEGSAGGNPTLTCWTELWGFTLERFKRLWDELTPVPTRKRSMRWVETYAGFEDESELLLDLYKLGMRGRRATVRDLEPYAWPAGSDPWPYADRDAPPIWINEDARMLTYWDTAIEPTHYARRMPWQVGVSGDAYYKEQATQLRPEAYSRLHCNLWQNSVSEFLPIAWWQACQRPEAKRAIPRPESYPTVMFADASISGDCTAIGGISRHPDESTIAREVTRDGKTRVESTSLHETDTVARFSQVWFPADHGGTINYKLVEDAIRDYCARYNVVCMVYDQYQLHDMMQRLTRDGVVWCKVFSQAADREIADMDFYSAVRDRRHWHDGEFDEQFVKNAAAHQLGQGAKVERLRIVKKAKGTPVDPLVGFSMARSECLRLLL